MKSILNVIGTGLPKLGNHINRMIKDFINKAATQALIDGVQKLKISGLPISKM